MDPPFSGRVVTLGMLVPRRIVVTGRAYDHDAALRPVEAAEKEARRDAYARTPVETRVAVVVVRWRRPDDGRIGRPPPAPVDQERVVVGHVDDPRGGRLDDDGFFFPHDPRVLGVFETAVGVRARAQELDGVHHVLLLE